jgi:dipicolinate synthase subunit B
MGVFTMKLNKCNIGFAVTGSFCTFDKIKEEIQRLIDEKANVIPIFSFNCQHIDSRFVKARDYIDEIERITSNRAILTIEDAEPIGPGNMLDAFIIAPCTGNTLAKLSNGITDTPVLMAAKAHMRNNKPLIISISTNDSLGINFKNIGLLMNMKNIYFVPFGQDNPTLKPNSMIAHTELIVPAIEEALEGRQLQPAIISP